MTWDFERIFLALMAVLIVAGLGTIVWMESRAGTLEGDKRQSEALLSDVGRLAQEVYELQQEKADDISLQEGAYGYFDKMQIQSRIGSNSFKINASSNPYPSDGYEESVYNLKPERNKLFTREQVAKFLLNVERYTTRMRVTRLRLSYNDNGSGDQVWSPDIYVTERRPLRVD